MKNHFPKYNPKKVFISSMLNKLHFINFLNEISDKDDFKICFSKLDLSPILNKLNTNHLFNNKSLKVIIVAYFYIYYNYIQITNLLVRMIFYTLLCTLYFL